MPPLISTPLARRRGQRGDDRHRRRDHQRARARDHEQHQRPIEPLLPARAEHERRHDRDRRRQHDDDRRVDAREALDRRSATGARCACARSTRWMMRASVVSRRSRVTRTSSAPRPLMVPANTSSPGALSIGSDSPVTGAWLTSLWPATTAPSSGIFSPGLMTISAPGRDRVDARSGARPLRRAPARRRGVRSISALIAWRARSSVRASSACATANRKIDRRGLGPLAAGRSRRRRR